MKRADLLTSSSISPLDVERLTHPGEFAEERRNHLALAIAYASAGAARVGVDLASTPDMTAEAVYQGGRLLFVNLSPSA